MRLTARIGVLSPGLIHPVRRQTGETQQGHVELAYLGNKYAASTGPKSNKAADKGQLLVPECQTFDSLREIISESGPRSRPGQK